MRSELKENYLDASLSRGVWWEDHQVLEIWRCASSVLVTIFYSSFSVYMLFISLILACFWCFMINMLYAMIFRLVTYMFSYLRHPCLIWIYTFVFSHFVLTNVCVLDLCMCMYIMIIWVFVLISMLHVLITCLDVSFH